MVMIPKIINDGLIMDFEVESQPSKTHKMNFEDESIRSHTDDLEAIKQAVYKIINTERYQYMIYSWNYGIELQDLFGMPLPYVYPELKRRITEALIWDDRIEDVTDFAFTHKRGEVSATFIVHSVAGNFEAERTVRIT
jgi:phage baseplate assembly protein W